MRYPPSKCPGCNKLYYRLLPKMKSFRNPLKVVFPEGSTYFCPIALNWFNRAFCLQNRWEPLVLEWNSRSSLFCTRGIYSKSYFLSYFVIYGVCLLVGLTSLSLVITNPFGDPAITPLITLLASFMVSICALLVASVSILVVNLHEIVTGFQLLSSYTQNLGPEKMGLPGSCNFTGPNGIILGPDFWRRVSLTLILYTKGLLLISLLFPLVGVYLELDPFRFSIPAIFPVFPELKLTFTMIRLFLTIACVNEACRFLAFYLPLAIYFIELIFSSLESLHRILVDDYTNFLKGHRLLQFKLNRFHGAVSEIVGSLMGCGFFIFVISNVISIKCYRMLPLSVYIIFPFCSSLVCLVVYVCLPFTVFIAENSRENIRVRQAHFLRASNKNLSSLRREFHSVRPIIFRCASFYPLNKGTEAHFYFYVLLRTADFLLTATNLGVFDE